MRGRGPDGYLPTAVALAFFDLDKTILSVNSGSLWIRRELRLGHLSRWQAARAASFLLGYHLGYTALERVLDAGMASLAGTSARAVRERTLRFYAEEVRHRVRPGALRALEAHRAAGDRLVLLTSSSGYLSELFARDLRLDDVLCNRLEAVDDLHTGRTVDGLCFGPGKRAHAERLAERHQESLAQASFYTDSYSDLAMLEAVGQPVVVHPDPRLRREALRRRWPIVDWGVEPLAAVGLADPG